MKLRSADLSVRELGDELIILDLRSSRYLSVTGVGVELVKMLADDRTEDELVAQLLNSYAIDGAAARQDTTAFLGDLREAGLLE